jgi:serine/threonine protein kinase
MESVQGVTLREALTTLKKADRAMPFMIASDVTRQMCLGLDYAHTLAGPDGAPLEIVHQDISPTNIMLAFNGTVKILDFGIARAAEFAEEEAKKGLIKGKVSYLSPEQIHVRPFDARADVFAVGVVFHEMLTGRRLFQARNDITRMRQLLASPIPPPSASNATIPRELDRIVLRALEIDPRTRYQSTAEMAADLERTLIAARYSSRELSKLLHDLYLPSDDPEVVVEDEPEGKTIAATASKSATPPEPTHTTSRSAEESPRLTGALRAEGARLQRARWHGRAKVAAIAIAVGGAVGGVGLAVKRYAVPAAMRFIHPPAPPPPPVTANQAKPAELPPPPKPAKKRARRPKGHPTSEEAASSTPAGEAAPARPARGADDEPLPLPAETP